MKNRRPGSPALWGRCLAAFASAFAPWLPAVLAACSSSAEPAGGPAGAAAVEAPAASAGEDAASAGEDASEANATAGDVAGPCAFAAGQPSPRSILEAVERVNELPQPVTLACFIESLARPLELYATESLLSAQPAAGRRSPRAFIFSDPLIMSIAFDGVGSSLLEFGEARPGGLSVKAEIEFPVLAELSPAAPFERIHFTETITACGVCHDDEKPVPEVTFTTAFASRSLRPVPWERVSLESLSDERAICDGAREPERCALLDAVFGNGAVIDREFAETLATFY